MNIKEFILDCNFCFRSNSVSQLLKQLTHEISWDRDLRFDLSICGYFSGDTYFLIDEIYFSNFRSFFDGRAKIKFETNQEMLDSYKNSIGNVLLVNDFFNKSNKSIILVDSEGNSDTIQIEFSELKINFNH